MDLTRIIIVYLTQGSIVAVFAALIYKILQRERDRENLSFSGFYISLFLGFTLNFIYAPLTNQEAVQILNAFTNFFVFFGMIFLVVLNLILLKSKEVITLRIELFLIGLYGILLALMNVIPNGVSIGPQTGWKPVWSFEFFLYNFIVVTLIAIIPILVTSIMLYKRFEDKNLRRKWALFMVGIVGVFFIMYGTMISNTLNDPGFRTLWSFLSFTTLLWVYLIYYSVGKRD